MLTDKNDPEEGSSSRLKINPQILGPQNVDILRIRVPPYWNLRFRGFILENRKNVYVGTPRIPEMSRGFFSVSFVCYHREIFSSDTEDLLNSE